MHGGFTTNFVDSELQRQDTDELTSESARSRLNSAHICLPVDCMPPQTETWVGLSFAPPFDMSRMKPLFETIEPTI